MASNAGIPAARWGESTLHAAVPAAAPATVPATLLRAVQQLTSAASTRDVAHAAVAGALTLADARGAAVAVLADGGRAIEILASAGYDCDSMAAGARLPLDSGLPVTECVRTGRPRIAGTPGSPRWVVAPLAAGLRSPRGAVLLSLRDGADAPDLAVVESLAHAVGAALLRARRHDAVAERAAAAAQALRATAAVSGLPLEVALHVAASTDDVSGDVVDAWPAGADSWWLLVADVCGAGYDVAPLAASVRLAARAAARHAAGPGALLAELDAVLEQDDATDRFVTAVALRLTRRGQGMRAEVALAGHPAPLLWRAGELTRLGEPGAAVNLRLGLPVGVTQESLDLRPGDLLLLHTDGLPDRLDPRDGEDRVHELFGRAAAMGSAAAVVDTLVVALHSSLAATHEDDAAIAVLRVP